ncbi:MAG: serine/threonine protein kinase, partial [Clostridia bacterium]|nr:serine/threonine protein kinase [Clostridia bacterium]
MIGRILGGRYEILERVGGGGMAIVYRALDTFLNRPVAVKVLRPQFAADEELVARFRREARAAASLSDPRIVSVFDVGQDGDVYYIVMEYVDGSTLKRRIQEEGPFAPDAAAEVAKHILIALEHAHRAGIVHRDVKPQNVILTRDGRVKVTDFGIAQAAGGATLVHTDSILGTAHYLSPEQAKGRPADERSDVYATGIVLYEMLAGRPPFEGDSPLAVAMQHLQAEPPSLADFRDDVPGDLLHIVSRATAKEPVRRYASAEMFRRDLDAFLAGRPLPSRTEGEEPDEGATVALPSGFRATGLDPRLPADAAAARAARPAGAGEGSGAEGGGRDRRGGEGGRGAG